MYCVDFENHRANDDVKDNSVAETCILLILKQNLARVKTNFHQLVNSQMN